jgi:DNA-binding Lrp family transcriptional regulator
MATVLDPLDRQIIDLLKVNARLPIVKLAKALGCARSTAQLRLKALEDSGVISGYTVGVTATQSTSVIRAMMLISVQSGSEHDVQRALAKRHEIYKLYSVSGRYDLCAMLTTESTQELDTVIDKICQTKGVADTFSTILLATKLDRPD